MPLPPEQSPISLRFKNAVHQILFCYRRERTARGSSMQRKQINSKEASVAATFYEPVYQRLRQWHQGQAIDLLCFVNPTSDNAKRFLDECGAAPTKSFRAKCFAEVWELPHRDLVTGRFAAEPSEFDQRVAEAIGCHAGRFSAAAGVMQWSDHHEAEHKRRFVRSQLLTETASRRGRQL